MWTRTLLLNVWSVMLCIAFDHPCAQAQTAPPQPARLTEIPPREQPPTAAPATKGIVQFRGTRAFTVVQLQEAIAEQIREIGERGLTRPRADDTAYFLATYYRKQGFANVEIEWDIRGSQLLLTVREGPRIYLQRVVFQGNDALTEETLYEYLIGGTKERLQKEPKQFPFIQADVQNGTARIRGLYESEGFLDVVVEDPTVEFDRSSTQANVIVTIREGPRYGFGQIAFSGDTLFPRTELLKGLGTPLDEPYTAQRVNTMQRNLEFFYKSRGYFQAEIAASSEPSTARAAVGKGPDGRVYQRLVPATFTVRPGGLFRFNGITVAGLERLRLEFMENRFRDLKGDIYDPTELDETFRELLQTGLFQNLRINSVPQADNTIRLDLTVEEAKQKEFGFSLGFSSYEGLIFGFRVADRNFLRTGRALSLEIENSLRGLGTELLFVDPWFMESDYRMRLRLYAQGREEKGYSKRESGLRVDFLREVTENVDLGVFLLAENVEITESVIGVEYLGLTAYQIGTFGFTQAFDYRNHPLNPTKGWIVNTALDVSAIAGEVAFGRATVRVSHYIPLGERLLLALGARGGLILPFTSVPIDERYFSGGGTTVRSFSERELGPKDTGGNPIGGEAFGILNAELEFPVRGALRGAVFVDAGNLTLLLADAGVEDVRFGVGAGLRYKLPIGPVRLDIAANPNPKRFEEWGAVHFSFGFAF